MRGGWLFLDTRHSRETLLYAALEGVAFAVADCLDAMPNSGIHDDPLWLAGGATTTPAWRQLLADVLQARLAPIETPGASARGAALLGAAAAGLLDMQQLSSTAPPSSNIDVQPRNIPVLLDRRARYQLALQALRQLSPPAG